jgi:hypothetical protein
MRMARDVLNQSGKRSFWKRWKKAMQTLMREENK